MKKKTIQRRKSNKNDFVLFNSWLRVKWRGSPDIFLPQRGKGRVKKKNMQTTGKYNIPPTSKFLLPINFLKIPPLWEQNNNSKFYFSSLKNRAVTSINPWRTQLQQWSFSCNLKWGWHSWVTLFAKRRCYPINRIEKVTGYSKTNGKTDSWSHLFRISWILTFLQESWCP